MTIVTQREARERATWPTWLGWDAEYAQAAMLLELQMDPNVPLIEAVLLADIAQSQQDGLGDARAIAEVTAGLTSWLTAPCLDWFGQFSEEEQEGLLASLHYHAIPDSIPF